MRYLLIVLAACGRIDFNAIAHASDASADGPVAPSAGLVAYWPFDEGSGMVARDASGNGHDATITGGVTWTAGKLGGALMLDGTSGSLSTPEAADFHLALGACTLSAWVWDDTPGSMLGAGMFHRVINWYDGSDVEHVLALGNGPSGTTRVYFGGDKVIASGSERKGASTGDMSLGWHLVTASGDGTTYTLYIDGVVDTAGSLSVPISDMTDATTVFIGQIGTNSRFVHGLLDDLRIYDRGLSAQEVMDLYRATGG